MQIDVIAAVDNINRHGIPDKLCSVCLYGSVLSVLTQFLSNRSQHVVVDGCRSKLFNAASGVPQGSVSGQLLFLQYTSELFCILENRLISFTDDTTLIAVVPCTNVGVKRKLVYMREFTK